MRLRLRLLLLIISSLWRKPKMIDESVLSLRVLPNDIDITRITNDRYLALMDLGRVDYMLKTGWLRSLFKKKWVPVASFSTIRFRHSLKVFQKFLLRTRIIYWDEKTFYVQQVFERDGRIVVTGYMFGIFMGPKGPVSPKDVYGEMGLSPPRPEKPEIVTMLRELDETIHHEQKGKDPIP
jgi:acyl-CoA thioesterase FadM